MAKQDGVVLSVSSSGVIVQYSDGTKQGYQIGRIYGKAAGLIIPHEIVTDLKPGAQFKKGDPIIYNSGFFEKDVLNKNQIIWKSATIAKTVLLESPDTLEDSSAISSELSNRLRTKITKVRTVVVSFDQHIHRLVKPGDKLETESILCVIDDAIGGNVTIDEEILDTLRVLSSQTPLSKMKGVVERIEVYYHGELEDANESLKKIAQVSDNELLKRNKAANKPLFTGMVNEDFRIDNEPLAPDTMAIQIYITTDVPCTVGDKGVFANQMKTVIGRIFGDSVRTESGTKIDAIFGAKSIDDRIVLSPIIIGTTTTLLDVIAKKAVEIYRKN